MIAELLGVPTEDQEMFKEKSNALVNSQRACEASGRRFEAQKFFDRVRSLVGVRGQSCSLIRVQDIELHRKAMRHGQKVMLLYGSANRDERQFDAPDGMDTSRKPTQHLAFGYGTHFCLGASLARLESRIGFEHLLAGAPEYKLLTGAERNVGGIWGFTHLPAEFETA